MSTLSIIIPVYNEERTITDLLNALIAVHVDGHQHKEIIIIDDASTDKTASLLTPYLQNTFENCSIVYQQHKKNSGKGASIQTGIKLCSGETVLIQDADLEYNPSDINALVEPIIKGHADVVYGSRFISQNPHRVLYFWHRVGNYLLTTLSNMFSNINLTDMETGYKAFRSEVIKGLTLKERRFGVEPEITAKVAKIKGIRIYEVGISYFGRTYAEGKKISWKDGLRAFYCIIRYNLFN